MQYTVLVAEDEPLALRTVCSIIEKKCPAFRVIATADEGQDALAKARRLKPDLVISDIKMPRLTGVEMAEIIHKELPDICVLIISGYADFEYAQSAIRSGVTDYLLKPVVPSTLTNSLKFAEEKIRETHYYRRNRVIRKLARGDNVPKEDLTRFLPYSKLYIAVMCRGNLPGRYTMNSQREIYSGIDEQYFIFGRSEKEALYLVPETLLGKKEFHAYMESIRDRKYGEDSSYTLVYRKETIGIDRLQEGIHELYSALDSSSRIGESTVVEIGSSYRPSVVDKKTERELADIILNISNYAAAGAQDKIRAEIVHGYKICEERHCSQLWVENWTRELVFTLYRQGAISMSTGQRELLLNDLFSQADSMKAVSDGVIAICIDEDTERRTDKVDSQEFFDRIYDYLRQNLDQQISIQTICDIFSISQTYVGRLFRKYADASFSQSLTQMRIDRAREMFDMEPKPFIKDVAMAVGYTDQFYFSRVFRSYTGKSPSEYMKESE